MIQSSRKYELLKEDSVEVNGCILYRIKALRNFGNKMKGDLTEVHEGDLGGYVENESNLRHDGTCWVADNAKVYGQAQVWDSSLVEDKAEVTGTSTICDHSRISGNAKLSGHVLTEGNARVYGDAVIEARVELQTDAKVGGDCWIKHDMIIRTRMSHFWSSELFSIADVIGYTYKKLYTAIRLKLWPCDDEDFDILTQLDERLNDTGIEMKNTANLSWINSNFRKELIPEFKKSKQEKKSIRP